MWAPVEGVSSKGIQISFTSSWFLFSTLQRCVCQHGLEWFGKKYIIFDNNKVQKGKTGFSLYTSLGDYSLSHDQILDSLQSYMNLL